MIRKKIFFSIFVIFFLLLMIFFTLAFNLVIDFPKKNIAIIGSNENPNKNLDCVPIIISNPTIILRLDDIRSNTYKNIRFDIIDEILNRNLPVVIGVIPSELSKDKKLINYINKNLKNSKLEVAQHGYLHTIDEFGQLNYTEALNKIRDGQKNIYDSFGFYPVTFIPPMNVYSVETVEALKELNFKILSSGEGEYKFDGSLLFLGKNAQTFDFEDNNYISSEFILQKCMEKLELTNICIIMIHPQDYYNNQKKIEKWKFEDFKLMLDELKKLNVEFRNPRDLVYCKDIIINQNQI